MTSFKYRANGAPCLRVARAGGIAMMACLIVTSPASAAPAITFDAPQAYEAAGPTFGFAAMASGDFNGDGRIDAAVADTLGGGFTVLLSRGDSQYERRAISFKDDSAPVGMTSGDFDGDGKADLAMVSRSFRTRKSVVVILYGVGDGSFVNGPSFSAEGQRDSMTAGDVDGDGRDDLVLGLLPVPRVAGQGLLLVRSLSERRFATPEPLAPTQPGKPYLVDITGDGRKDLIILAGSAADQQINRELQILPANGRGGFDEPRRYALAEAPDAAAFGDFNGDGKKDLVVSLALTPSANDHSEKETPNALVFWGDGKGNLRAGTAFFAGRRADGLATGDFNGDGISDLVAGDTGNSPYVQDWIRIFYGSKTGRFTQGARLRAPFRPADVAVGRVDGDDKADVIGWGVLGQAFAAWRNDGHGGFGQPRQWQTGVQPIALAKADLNEDGTEEIIVAFAGAKGEKGGLAIVDRTKGHGAARMIQTGSRVSGLVAADLNRDGHMDLAVTARDGRSLRVLLGDGQGGLKLAPEVALSSVPAALTAIDYDGDGRLELAVAGVSGPGKATVELFSVGEAGALKRSLSSEGNWHPVSLLGADLDGDRKQELLLVDEGESALNPPQGGLPPLSSMPRPAPGAAPPPGGLPPSPGQAGGRSIPRPSGDNAPGGGGVFVTAPPPGENGDAGGPPRLARGRPEGGGTLRIFHGGESGLSPASALTLGHRPSSVASADLNGDHQLDVVVSARGELNDGRVIVFLNRGKGELEKAAELSALSRPAPLVIEDLNGDGVPDLAVANQLSNAISVFEGKGDGSFSAPRHYVGGGFASALIASRSRRGALADLVTADQGFLERIVGEEPAMPGNTVTMLENQTR